MLGLQNNIKSSQVCGPQPCELFCLCLERCFTAQTVAETYPLGSKSNIDRIKKALIDKELITPEKDGIFIADSVFELWLKKEMI